MKPALWITIILCAGLVYAQFVQIMESQVTLLDATLGPKGGQCQAGKWTKFGTRGVADLLPDLPADRSGPARHPQPHPPLPDHGLLLRLVGYRVGFSLVERRPGTVQVSDLRQRWREQVEHGDRAKLVRALLPHVVA